MENAASPLPAYVALTANRKRVLLPAGAAGRSRFLHNLLDGLHIMTLATAGEQHRSSDSGAPSPSHVDNDRTDLYTAMALADGADKCAGGEEAFTCYARAYPTFRRSADPTDGSGDAGAVAAASPVLEVPLGVVDGATMARIAEFLVHGAAMSVAPPHSDGGRCCRHRRDPLSDLDCTSSEDQLAAVLPLLGADLLGC